MIDMSESIEPRSDQWNADDLIAGPATVTIERVISGKAEHPFDFLLVETPARAYRPSKSMRRVIVAGWGADADAYAGRRLTLYREPTITFGGKVVGGIRISHMSDIPRALNVSSQVARGKRETFTVQPLPEIAPSVAGAATTSGPPPAEAAPLAAAATPQPPVTTGEGADATAGNGPTLKDQYDALSDAERDELRRLVPIPDGAKLSDVERIIGADWARNLAGLLEKLRLEDCTLAELNARNAAAAESFEQAVKDDTLPPTASQERELAGNPEPGDQVPMYGPGSPS